MISYGEKKGWEEDMIKGMVQPLSSQTNSKPGVERKYRGKGGKVCGRGTRRSKRATEDRTLRRMQVEGGRKT